MFDNTEGPVQSNVLLATYVPPDENFLGTAVWVSLALLASSGFFVSPTSPLGSRLKRLLQGMLPLLALCWAFSLLFTGLRAWFIGDDYFYKRQYYQLDMAFLITVAFGEGFSLGDIRSGDKLCRKVGWCSAGVYALVIGLVAFFLNSDLLSQQ